MYITGALVAFYHEVYTVDFPILAERDLGFSLVFAKFKMADQCAATEGELNFHKRCTEAREIKISAGNLERTYPKGFRQDNPRTE